MSRCHDATRSRRADYRGTAAADDRPLFGTSEDATLLSVIIPDFNEAATIDQLLKRVVAAPFEKKIVVVDDGSTDRTVELLEKWEEHPQVELLGHAENRGKGAAIRTGLEHARGRCALIQDADLEYDPKDYPLLVEPLARGQADVVYGSRYLDSKGLQAPWSLFRVGVVVLNVVVRLLYRTRVTDEATCYKAFPTSLLRDMNLECERFEFCPEVTAKACRMGLRILEVPVSYQPRGRSEGKKIRWQDGIQALATLWKWRNWQPARKALPKESVASTQDLPQVSPIIQRHS